MTYQKKFVLLYLVSAAFIIMANYGAHAQEVIPDHKLKTNISSLNNSLESIMQLQPKRFQYNTRQYPHLQLPGGGSYGFISEEFQQVLPHLVRNEVKFYNNGKNSQQTALIPSIELEKLVPVLVGAIQEQQAMIQQLQEELATLKQTLAP
ncbi:MAG: topoisomerase [Adhaeribacter sp.]|jgi:hypothetical protein|nr:topoisomerase [Adhaeribacter sp.]